MDIQVVYNNLWLSDTINVTFDYRFMDVRHHYFWLSGGLFGCHEQNGQPLFRKLLERFHFLPHAIRDATFINQSFSGSKTVTNLEYRFLASTPIHIRVVNVK